MRVVLALCGSLASSLYHTKNTHLERRHTKRFSFPLGKYSIHLMRERYDPFMRVLACEVFLDKRKPATWTGMILYL